MTHGLWMKKTHCTRKKSSGVIRQTLETGEVYSDGSLIIGLCSRAATQEICEAASPSS